MNRRVQIASLRVIFALLALPLFVAACGSSSDVLTVEDEGVEVGEEGHHDHDHDESAEVPEGVAVPEIAIEVMSDPKEGFNVHVTLDNFTINPAAASTDPVDGEGHLHWYLDGAKQGRIYGEWFHVKPLTVGDHEITVEVSANDHSPMSIGGEVINASVTVAGTEEETANDSMEESHDDANVHLDISFADGVVSGVDDRVEIPVGSVVEVNVTSDVAEEVHVHGYDVFGHLVPGEPTVVVFEADIPGVFEIELEGAGQLLAELAVS